MWRECNSSTLEIIPHSGILQELKLKENRERQVRGSKQSWRDLFLSSGLPSVPGLWREWCQMVTTRRNWGENLKGRVSFEIQSGRLLLTIQGINWSTMLASGVGLHEWFPNHWNHLRSIRRADSWVHSRHAESEWGGEAKDGALSPCQALFRVLTVLGTISMATNIWFNTSAFFLIRYWSL